MSKWMNFNKRVELISKTSHYINRMKELKVKCSKKQNGRERRQIDNALLTAADFGFKQFRERILNAKITELKGLNIENLDSKSKGVCRKK